MERVCEDYYLGHVRLSRAPKGATEVRRMFATMLGETAKVPAAALTRAQAFDLIKSYAESTPVQARRLRAELGAAWDYAIDAGRLDENTPNWSKNARHRDATDLRVPLFGRALNVVLRRKERSGDGSCFRRRRRN